MNVFEKIKRLWWVLISFIMFINGLGFVYAGIKHNNRNWVFEGIMYEIPWIFLFIYPIESMAYDAVFIIAMVLMLVSIIRSIWVAIKLADVYDNEDKYTVRPTVMRKQANPQENHDGLFNFGCCLCLLVIFIVFAIVAL